MAIKRFNYEKEYKNYQDYAYYGFHRRRGRFYIDTKRLTKLGYASAFPKELFSKPRNVHYFLPARKNVDDYAVNQLRAVLNGLKRDWDNEYKDFISSIKTPEQVYDNVRINELSMTGCSDDYDDIEIDARMASWRYISKYVELVSSIHLQYLQKIFIEYLRTIYLVIKNKDHKEEYDFESGYLYRCVQEKFPKRKNPIYSLPHHKYFDALNKIVNFLKHNTKRSYEQLANNPVEKDKNHKDFLASFVCSKEDMGKEYETGMYAGYWIKADKNTVDEMLKNLFVFSEELCCLMYDEDAKESMWNSDEALLNILRDNFYDFV